MSATNMPAPRRSVRPIDRKFESGGQSDFAVLGALVPNDPDARAILRKEAAKRGLSVEGVLRRIVDTIVSDGLFGAVLDDAEEVRRRRR